jgi:hypothetical protein
MGDPSGILITIEGWGVNLAGCFGNSLLPTPSIDRLAAHGNVIDQFWMHSVQLEPNIHAILDHIHPSRWLVASDSRIVANLLRQKEDLEHIEVTHDTSQEAFEHLLTESLECWIQQRHQTPYLWIHSQGLSGAWDAPYEYRKLMCDSQDPDPPQDRDPPDLILKPDFDPDLLFGLACGAGAQSLCIDQGIGLVDQMLKELGIDQRCWVALAGMLGFPLGEHHRVGLGSRRTASLNPDNCPPDAYSERLHTPCIIRTTPSRKLGTRCDKLLQPGDLGDWIERMVETGQSCEIGTSPNHLQIAWALGFGEIALITNRWSGRFDILTEFDREKVLDPTGEVYCFPEDRWQQNEVASRVPEVDSLLRQIASTLINSNDSEPLQSEHLHKPLSELFNIRR